MDVHDQIQAAGYVLVVDDRARRIYVPATLAASVLLFMARGVDPFKGLFLNKCIVINLEEPPQ